MYLPRVITLISTVCILSILIYSCKKETIITDEPAVQSEKIHYDFLMSADYPTARSLVRFTPMNVPEGLPQTWYVNGVEHLSNDFKYSFPKAGTYTIKLVVNYDEVNSVTKELLVVPGSIHTKYEGVRVIGETISFISERSDGGEHFWDFGDGSTSTDNDPKHVFTKAGEYKVNLTVTGLEDKPLTSYVRVTILDDPIHTKKMVGNRTWHVMKQHINRHDNTDTTYMLPVINFTIEYVDKLTVSIPSGQSYITGHFIYDEQESTKDLLVYRKGNIASSGVLYYDPVADTMLCRGLTYPDITPKGANPNIQDHYTMRTP